LDPKGGKVDPKWFAIPSGACHHLTSPPLGSFFGKSKKFPSTTESVKDFIYGFVKQAQEATFEGLLNRRREPKPQYKEPKTELIVRQKPIPNLAQAFSADFSVTYNDSYWSPRGLITMTGSLAFDFTQSGFYLMIKSINVVPFSLSAGFIIYPDRGGLEWIMVGPTGEAWGVFYLPWIITFIMPTYSLPPDAQYLGQTVINGDPCDVWDMYWTYRSTRMWVRSSDGAVVKATNFQDVFWSLESGTITLSNIKLSVDPSLYQRPKSIAETMTFNHNFASHLSWYWCEPFC